MAKIKFEGDWSDFIREAEKASKVFGKLTSESKKSASFVGRAWDGVVRGIHGGINRLKRLMGPLGLAGMITGGIAGIFAIHKFKQSFSELTDSIAHIGTLGNRSWKEMTKLRDVLRGMVTQWHPFGEREMGGLGYLIESAGLGQIGSPQFQAMMDTITKFAAIGGAELETSFNAISRFMRAFGGTDPQKYANLALAINEFGQMNLQELAHGLPFVAGAWAQSASSAEAMGAAVATLTRTLQPEQTFTALSGLIMGLAAPTENVKKQMKELNLEWGKAKRAADPFVDMLMQLREMSQKVSQERTLAFIREIVPEREAVRALSGLMRDLYSPGGFLDIYQQILGSGDMLGSKFQIAMHSATNIMKDFWKTIRVVGEQALQPFFDVLLESAGKVAEIFRGVAAGAAPGWNSLLDTLQAWAGKLGSTLAGWLDGLNSALGSFGGGTENPFVRALDEVLGYFKDEKGFVNDMRQLIEWAGQALAVGFLKTYNSMVQSIKAPGAGLPSFGAPPQQGMTGGLGVSDMISPTGAGMVNVGFNRNWILDIWRDLTKQEDRFGAKVDSSWWRNALPEIPISAEMAPFPKEWGFMKYGRMAGAELGMTRLTGEELRSLPLEKAWRFLTPPGRPSLADVQGRRQLEEDEMRKSWADLVARSNGPLYQELVRAIRDAIALMRGMGTNRFGSQQSISSGAGTY